MINEKISKIAQRLWDLNESKLTRKVDYELDLQEPYNNELPAEVKKPVLSITMDNLTKKPTFKTFLALLSKYIPGACERMTEEEEDEEIAENDRFVNSCLNTNLMKEAHRFLVEEGKAPEDTFSFKEMLREIWFDFYSRREKTSDENKTKKIEGLSTFQHVFVGDYKGKTKVLGCHYWLDYYALQRKALVSYHGYIPSGTVYKDEKTEEPALISIAFTMDGVFKPTEVFLIGLSPEFEFALYTIIFLCGETRTRVKFANLEVEFYCHKIERDGREFLAALYPTEAQHE